MRRRDVLRVLGGAAAASLLGPLGPSERLRVATELHARLRPGAFATLTPAEAELVAAVAEIVIPATDTPGATDARVAEFVDLLLTEWYAPDERDRLRAGLARIDALAVDTGTEGFVALPGPARVAMLERLDGVRGDLETAEGAFARLKSLTVYGYFTSRVAQTEVLRTVIIPGRYDGCPAPEVR